MSGRGVGYNPRHGDSRPRLALGVRLAVWRAGSSTARAQDAYRVPDELTRQPQLPEGMRARPARVLSLSEAIQVAVQQNLGITLYREQYVAAQRFIDVQWGKSFEPGARQLQRQRDHDATPALPAPERRQRRGAQHQGGQLVRRRLADARDRDPALGRILGVPGAHPSGPGSAPPAVHLWPQLHPHAAAAQELRLRHGRAPAGRPARALRLGPRRTGRARSPHRGRESRPTTRTGTSWQPSRATPSSTTR